MGPQPPPEMISKSKTKTQGKMHDDIPPRDMIMNLPNQMMLHFENDSEFEIDADINYEIGKLNYAADIAGSDIDIDDGIEEGEISEGEIIEDGQVGTDKKKRKLNDIDDVYWKEVNNSDSGNECKSNKDIREQKSNAVKLKDNNDNNDNDNDVVIGVGVNKNSLVPYTPSSDEEDKVKNGTGGNDGGSVCLSEVSVPSAKGSDNNVEDVVESKTNKDIEVKSNKDSVDMEVLDREKNVKVVDESGGNKESKYDKYFGKSSSSSGRSGDRRGSRGDKYGRDRDSEYKKKGDRYHRDKYRDKDRYDRSDRYKKYEDKKRDYEKKNKDNKVDRDNDR
eukprot:552628_1